MNIDREKADFLDKVIAQWEDEEIISSETAKKLKSSYTIKDFDWKKLAQYAIYIALACGVFSLASLLIDDEISRLISKIFDTPNYLISIFSALIASFAFYFGHKRRLSKPKEQFTNEAILFIGIMFVANTLIYLGKTLATDDRHQGYIFLLAVPIYGFLGYYFRSRLIWAFALFSLAGWFGVQSNYVANHGHYFLGMNYPLRFVCFGAIITAAAFLLKKNTSLRYFFKTTYFTGLLFTFFSMWMLSIFGNFSGIAQWEKVNQLALYSWALLSVFFCIGVLFLGFRFKDNIAREFGVTFLIINLYSRFFEYFWDSWHKAFFFLVLALSFWFIGRKAEKIWNLELFKK